MPSWIESALHTLTAQERAVYVASLGAVALAWAVTQRQPAHRPLALLLSIGLTADIATRALKFAVIAPAYVRFGGAPFEGWARVAGHVEQGLFLAWPASFVAAARVSFDESRSTTRRTTTIVAAAWASLAGALALAYPLIRGAALARVYLAVELAALLIVIFTIGAWVRERRTPQLHQVSIALICAAELAVLAGPWRINLFGSWPLAQGAYLALFVLLIVLQGGSLWLFRGPSR